MVEVVVCPPALHATSVCDTIRGDVSVAAQDISLRGVGPFTGNTFVSIVEF